MPLISFTPDGCPYSLDDIEHYLDCEDYDRDRASMSFYCSAELPDRTYWIWRYKDLKREDCLAVVTRMADGSRILSCGSDPSLGESAHAALASYLLEHDV